MIKQREILFRGKRVDNGEWVYGAYGNHTSLDAMIIDRPYPTSGGDLSAIGFWVVDPTTVGQYTGLEDKNGQKIFEGDIIKSHYANARQTDFVERVVFHNGRFCSMYKLLGGGKMWANLPDGVPYLPQDKTVYMEWCEVIGNIHANPELVGGGDR